MPVKKTTGPKTADIDSHFSVMQVGPSLNCLAYFTGLNGAPIVLESDALITCNDVVMPESSATYSVFLNYTPGMTVTINSFRPIDGSAYSKTFYP